MNEKIKQYRAEITEKIINTLKDGTAPWLRPWGYTNPYNAVTHREYNGINKILLILKDFIDPRWCTFKQASAKGWKIKKGEKGVKVIFWSCIEKENDDDAEDNKSASKKSKYFMQKIYTIFHASQIDGMPEIVNETISSEQCNAKAEMIIRGTGADIRHGGLKAFYSCNEDYIQVPKIERFESITDYYATILHELTHWSGAPSRLNRKKGEEFGDENYAREELIAEIASMFLSAETGIPQTQEHFYNHAAYISSWIELLKSDSNAIFKAAADANKAAEFILSFANSFKQEQAA